MLNIINFIKYFLIGIVSLPKIIISIIYHFLIGILTIITIFPKYFFIGLKAIFKRDKNIIKKQLKKDNPKKVLIMMILAFTIYLVCIFLISRWSVQQLKIKYLTETITENTEEILKEESIIPEEIPNSPPNLDNNEENSPNESGNNNQHSNTTTYYPNDYWDYINVPFISVNFNELLNKNPDTVGWIKINNTKVNYPIVQTDNNTYYLDHAFNKTKNAGGWIYADYRSNLTNFGKNTIIYGHNITNRTMFGSLVETQKKYWYTNPDNKYIKISTPTSNTVWAIFSTYIIEPEIEYLRTNFEKHSFQDFITKMKSRSIYNFGIDVNENDKILTLSTCNETGTKRIVVQAKMVTINYR